MATSNKWLILCCMWLAGAGQAWAVEKPLDDPEEEARAEVLFHQIKCTPCQTESVADSPADVASEIRVSVREHILQGDTTSEIEEALVADYGDAVQFRGPVAPITIALTLGPFLLLLTSGIVIWWYFKFRYKPQE